MLTRRSSGIAGARAVLIIGAAFMLAAVPRIAAAREEAKGAVVDSTESARFRKRI